jgi:hypothetical protein
MEKVERTYQGAFYLFYFWDRMERRGEEKPDAHLCQGAQERDSKQEVES